MSTLAGIAGPRSTRAVLGTAGIVLALAALAPDPVALWCDAPQRRPEALLDPSLRVPFASILLRSDQRLAPGDRVLGVRVPGDPGLYAPHDRAALLRTAAAGPVGASIALEVRGPSGDRRVETPLATRTARQALAEQWPVALAGAALLFLALCCVAGGRHPVAAPLGAVSGCLAMGVLAALDLVLPGDAGLLGLGAGRARLGTLAWSTLPAALLHLAARFPVVLPRFRRPALAALPYALWAIPALLAQLRFGEPAVVHAVERVTLAASFVAGAVLVAACLAPGRRLAPIERVRARALVAGLLAAGAGPLVIFVAPHQPARAASLSLALGATVLPLSLGWAVARYRLLDPPPWLARALRSLARRRGARAGAPEALLARAGRELAGARSPAQVLEQVRRLLVEELGAGAVEIVAAEGAAPAAGLGARGRVRWACAGATRSGRLLRLARAEDPDAREPDVVLRIEPRVGGALLAVVAPRDDGLPYSPEELRALDDVGRLTALALGDAAGSALLERCVADRTAALEQALDDRTALVGAAERIQAAGDAAEVRAAVAHLLEARTGRRVRSAAGGGAAPDRIVAELARPPAGREWLRIDGLAAERAGDLQPQVEALCAFANLALERLHLLDGLKLEVARQARELARVSSGRRHAEFVRRAAHELRKPNEEIQHLVAPLRAAATGGAREALAGIERASCELARRLDCLLSRQGLRCDARRVDLVRLIDEAVRRVALLRADRRLEVSHREPRLPLVGDPVRLASLVENLLDNAVKATCRGGRIRVRSALAGDSRARALRLEVEDDGAGIPTELGADLFEPGVARFPGGFGLGLALCRDVAAAHGGRIEVESRPGRTLFRVVLAQLQEAAP